MVYGCFIVYIQIKLEYRGGEFTVISRRLLRRERCFEIFDSPTSVAAASTRIEKSSDIDTNQSFNRRC